MKVLGIESSCDETAAAVVEDGRVLSDVIASQVTVHQPYGGVVPELASRNHMVSLVPVLRGALERANIDLNQLDGIVATAGPGLMGSLLVGLQAAKTLAVSIRLPFCGINHLRGHLLAARIEDEDLPRPEFPYMALLASGGHTGVYHVEGEDRIMCLGQTRDDAAGEAFDKVAKLLGLGYPGGPVIDRMAEREGPEEVFPQALRQRRSYEFSFSGIKTAVAQRVAAMESDPTDAQVEAVVRGFQRAVVEILTRKVVLAAREKQVERVVLAGGVAANKGLRAHAAQVCAENDLELFAPPPSRCTDNASMIAYAGYLSLKRGERSPLDLAPGPAVRFRMGVRVLGLDVGSRKIGVAVSDEMGLIAQPLTYVPVEGEPGEVVSRIGALCREHDVDTVVVGLPLSLDGGDRGSSARRARSLGERLSDELGVVIVYRDERFSTAEAERLLVSAKVRRKDRKEAVDKMAAALILQGYLDGR